MSEINTIPIEPHAEAAASPDAPDARTWQELGRDFLLGVATQSWLASMVFHMALMVVLALVMGTLHLTGTIGQSPAFDPVDESPPAAEVTHFEVGHTPLEPTELTTETLMLTEAPSVEAQFNDNSPVFEEAGGGLIAGKSELGGLGGFNITSAGLGPVVQGTGGVGAGAGFGDKMGTGGAATGFGSRGAGMREAMLGNGATKQSERAVAAALNWLARHQNGDGRWMFLHTKCCKSGHCSGPGSYDEDTAATALGLLPFLAAGQTHQSEGPYQENIKKAVNWLIRNQKKRTGDLSTGPQNTQMYAHGMAAIALCEAFGMTQDSRVREAAQLAINFIESGQNLQGGWRYSHGTDDSDTSVFGWQVMALKSGQMAGLRVNPRVLEACKRYLASCARGPYQCEFSYQPGGRSDFPMTSVGLLTAQYLGARRDQPVIVGGIEYLMKHQPTLSERNSYYWYYATQVMHNVPGPEWDEWNRQMRRLLIETQEKTGHAAGSWDPGKPEADAWGSQGGRLMVTSFCCLTLEVYYRYLPLYQLDQPQTKPDKEAPKVE